jgi:PD-(D/E)XK nuclease superfamily protein
VNPREQGDLGEVSAIEWLTRWGARVWVPISHSPDIDLIAEKDLRLWRVQVKTCGRWQRGRWSVSVCTRGGNQSWNGVVKRLDPSRCDYLFILAADGRRWFIPSRAFGGGTAINVGGPKYAEYEVDQTTPMPVETATKPGSRIDIPQPRGDARAAKGIGL